MSELEVCTKCEGRGEFMLSEADGMVKCGRCNGTGKAQRTTPFDFEHARLTLIVEVNGKQVYEGSTGIEENKRAFEITKHVMQNVLKKLYEDGLIKSYECYYVYKELRTGEEFSTKEAGGIFVV